MRARGIEAPPQHLHLRGGRGRREAHQHWRQVPAGEVATETLIWCAGVAASWFAKNSDLPAGRARPRARGRGPAVTGDDGPRGCRAAGGITAVPDLTGSGPGGFCVRTPSTPCVRLPPWPRTSWRPTKGEALEDYYHENLGSVAAGPGPLQGCGHHPRRGRRAARLDHAPALPRRPSHPHRGAQGSCVHGAGHQHALRPRPPLCATCGSRAARSSRPQAARVRGEGPALGIFRTEAARSSGGVPHSRRPHRRRCRPHSPTGRQRTRKSAQCGFESRLGTRPPVPTSPRGSGPGSWP
ncbi:hypothetical protein QJS66_08500 [Kocuria rhizophila]|nr:hypothetical protein QJS66_08500 [Kocuria rhizophila]